MNADNIRYVLKNRRVICDIAREHRADAAKAWKEARKAVPGIEKVMDFDGFVIYAALLITAAQDADKASKETEHILRQEYETRMTKLHDLEQELEQVGLELQRALQDRTRLEKEIESLQLELEESKTAMAPSLAEVTPAEVVPAEKAGRESSVAVVPGEIDGWTIRRTKDGYYRLYRRIKGKGHSMTLGKSFDPEEARQKITWKEHGLREAG